MAVRLALLTLLVALLPVRAAEPTHTPARNSPERKAICDGARTFVLEHYVAGTPLPQPLLFKIQRLQVRGDFASLEALPVFADGSPVGTDYIMDLVFDLCLQRSDQGWRVICDLSSTDVPDKKRVRQLRRTLDKHGFPVDLLSKFWRDLFTKAG